MIVALIFADISASHPANQGTVAARCLDAVDGETRLEVVTGTVLRGPFGGTLVAAHPGVSSRVKSALNGFAVRHVDIPTSSGEAQPAVLAGALKAADEFRARWEKARAAATGRFDKTDDTVSRGGKAEAKAASGEWSKHKQSADVKIRGLARSFERDGVLLLPGDCVEIDKEHLARMVEGFARDGQSTHPKPFAQAVAAGVRSWPVMMTWEGAREIEALPPGVDLSEWLLKNVERVCDVPI